MGTGMKSGELNASVFELLESGPGRPVRALWDEIQQDLCEAFPEKYAPHSKAPYAMVLLHELSVSTDRSLLRYRTLDLSILSRRDSPTLIEVSIGNLFVRADDPKRTPIATSDYPRHAKWSRNKGMVSLREHVALAWQAMDDLADAGWLVSLARLMPVEVSIPRVRSAGGVAVFSPGNMRQMVRNPISMPPLGWKLRILGEMGRSPVALGDKLGKGFDALFRNSHAVPANILSGGEPEENEVALIVLDDDKDLLLQPDMLKWLASLERQGWRFKLAKRKSLLQDYPLQNICYDLFLLAGGRPWNLEFPVTPIVAMDAGHSVEAGRSRWAMARMGEDMSINGVRFIETELAEHLPESVLSAFWPTEKNATVCRDGRLARERQSLVRRAELEHRALWEVRKHPKAIMFRGDPDSAQPAQFGDALTDPHDDQLIQTIPQKTDDYSHPLRLNLAAGDTDIKSELGSFFVQVAVPAMSMFNLPRLPGGLYWADLASKLSAGGWTQVIGRGFEMAEAVPKIHRQTD